VVRNRIDGSNAPCARIGSSSCLSIGLTKADARVVGQVYAVALEQRCRMGANLAHWGDCAPSAVSELLSPLYVRSARP
jgi:hypothetical protein